MHVYNHQETIKKLRVFIKELHEKLEEVHPNWQECRICSSPMNYLLKKETLDPKSFHLAYTKDRIRAILRNLKHYPEVYSYLNEKYKNSIRMI
jgi:predicted translin family RNA/ssDNA-binding protein